MQALGSGGREAGMWGGWEVEVGGVEGGGGGGVSPGHPGTASGHPGKNVLTAPDLCLQRGDQWLGEEAPDVK